MKFFELDKDDREAWRHGPTTRAFIARLAEEIEDSRRGLEALAQTGSTPQEVGATAGIITGLRMALDLITTEEK